MGTILCADLLVTPISFGSEFDERQNQDQAWDWTYKGKGNALLNIGVFTNLHWQHLNTLMLTPAVIYKKCMLGHVNSVLLDARLLTKTQASNNQFQNFDFHYLYQIWILTIKSEFENKRWMTNCVFSIKVHYHGFTKIIFYKIIISKYLAYVI